MDVEHGKVERLLPKHHGLKMVGNGLWVAYQQIIGAQKPIGERYTQDRRDERAQTHGQHVGGKQNPKNGNQPQQFHIKDAGHTDGHKGVEHPSNGLLVLKGAENEVEREDERQLRYANVDG